MATRARRGPGEGSVRQLKDGRWQARLTVDGKQRPFYGKTRKEALGKLREAQAKQAEGRLAGTSSQPLSQYLDAWLETAGHEVRPKTLENYKLNVRRLVPHLGTIRLDKLTPAQVQNAYNKLLARDLSRRSVEQAHTVLRTALQHAVDLDLVVRNVADRTKPPHPGKTERPTLTLDQMTSLIEKTSGDRFGALWVVLGTAGLRLGEALGLKWADLDLERGTLTIRRALQRQAGSGLVFVEPKSASGRRTVDLGKLAVDALRAQRERQAFERKTALSLGRWTDHDLVFASEVGTGLETGRVHKHFKATLARLNLPDIRLHDLRHSCATLMLEQGVHLRVVQEMLGHSSFTLTAGTYSHVGQTMHRDAADALDARIRGKMGR